MEWEEPPEQERRDWQAIANELKANPNRWASITLTTTAYVSHIKNGTTKAFRPAGSFEARSSKGKIFIRYIGKEKA
jgi:hypothetical protein